MSGVAVIQYLLAHAAAVTTVVPADRIVGGDVPLGMAYPAIGVKSVGAVGRNTTAMTSARRLMTERVQVTVVAKTYKQKKTIHALIAAACPNTRGTVNGVDCDSVIPDSEGPDLDDSETGIYQQSQDFFVKYNR